MADVDDVFLGTDDSPQVIKKYRDMGDGTHAERVFVTDPWMQLAIDEIYQTYGDVVVPKAKSLRKFGRTLNANDGVRTTVAEFQDSVVNETYATGNTVDYLVSTDAADAGKVFNIEGNTQNLTTGDFTFVSQNVTCAGQTPVALGTPLARPSRCAVPEGTYASPSVAPVGDVAVYDSTLSGGGVTSGKPDVDAAVKLMILGASGRTQSEKCATTISANDYWLLTLVDAGVTNGGPQDATVLVEPEYRTVGGVFRPLGIEVYRYGGVSDPPIPIKPYIIVPKNSDVRIAVTSDKASTQVTARLVGQLLSVQ